MTPYVRTMADGVPGLAMTRVLLCPQCLVLRIAAANVVGARLRQLIRAGLA